MSDYVTRDECRGRHIRDRDRMDESISKVYKKIDRLIFWQMSQTVVVGLGIISFLGALIIKLI